MASLASASVAPAASAAAVPCLCGLCGLRGLSFCGFCGLGGLRGLCGLCGFCGLCGLGGFCSLWGLGLCGRTKQEARSWKPRWTLDLGLDPGCCSCSAAAMESKSLLRSHTCSSNAMLQAGARQHGVDRWRRAALLRPVPLQVFKVKMTCEWTTASFQGQDHV